MAFTTWTALKTEILNDLASGNGTALTKSYAVRDRSRVFQSLREVREFLEFCDLQIMAEGGSNSRQTFVQFGRPS